MIPLHFQLMPDNKVLVFANGVLEDDKPAKKAIILTPDDGWFKIRVDDAMFLFSQDTYVFYHETPDTIHGYTFGEIKEGTYEYKPVRMQIRRIGNKWDVIFLKLNWINLKGFLGAKAFGFSS